MNKSALLRYCKKRIIRILLFPFKLLPIQNHRVLLINDMSSHYTDNLKYIGEEIRKRNKNIKLIYAGHSLDCVDALREIGIVPVEMNTLKYFFYGMTARVLVTNSGGVSYLPLKKCQYVMNTWHGGGAYKKMGVDMYEDTTLFRKDLLLASKETDIFLATCERFKDVFCKAMLVSPAKFWNIGMPRNDSLKNRDYGKAREVKKRIGLNDNQRLVLFAPTYRKRNDNYFNESVAISYGINEVATCEALKERFGGEWVFAYRYHPCIVNKQNHEQHGNLLDLTDYDDMQELLLTADVLINDFSSCMWDFMLTGKPCFIFAKDLHHYIETTDLYTPVSDWPFPVAESNEELISNILNFDEKSYEENCTKHYELLGGCETGKATKKACDWIMEKCEFSRR